MKAVEGKPSNWLTILLVARHHFDLSPTEFRSALALCYHRPSLGMPAHCDGCEATYFQPGACPGLQESGLVTQRHNEVRNALGDIAALAYREVARSQ